MRMEENLAYMREWIGYHIYLGADKIFIYDNYGSHGNLNRATVNKTKYGMELSCFGVSNEEAKKEGF